MPRDVKIFISGPPTRGVVAKGTRYVSDADVILRVICEKRFLATLLGDIGVFMITTRELWQIDFVTNEHAEKLTKIVKVRLWCDRDFILRNLI